MKAKNLAIMLTDIKGFTDKTSRKSREQIKQMLGSHNDLVLPVIEKFHGKLIKTIGDAFLVTFESSTDAVLCGVSIQEVLAAFNKGKSPDDRIDIRIAINAGEVSIDASGDIFGEAVNITSRIEGIAEAGEVFFTEAVYLSMNRNEVPSSEIGYRQFKGIPDKIKVYKVLQEDPVTDENPAGESFFKEAPEKDREPAGDTPRERTDWQTFTKGPGGLAGMITGMLGKFGMNNIDIEEDGKSGAKKVKITDGEIHVVKDGKEIHIGKNGIKIRKIKKDDEQSKPQ
ncbi:MAG: hypothetical protein A2081_05705 [Elusimicrobia bacterium GWC2_61_19]|nr:MAG: hypothetical protein A2081_05705 [Elusimicrobia bacterium GWC2_61_19]